MDEKNIKFIKNFELIPEINNEYIGWREDVYIKDDKIYNKDNLLIGKTDETGQIIFDERVFRRITKIDRRKI